MCVRSTSPPARTNRVVRAADMGRNFWIWTEPFENAAVPTYSLVGRECVRENVRFGADTLHGVEWSSNANAPLSASTSTVIVNGRWPPELFGFSFGRLWRPPPHDSMNTSYPVRRTLTGGSCRQRRSHQLNSNVIRFARKNGRSVGVTP